MRRKNLLLVIGAFLIVSIVCVATIYLLSREDNSADQTDLLQPEGTHMVLHLSTYTLPYGKQPIPCSLFLFYDANGTVIKQHKVDEEVVGDFVVQTDTANHFFFKNQTVVATSDSQLYTTKSDISISSTNFGPSQTGYIEDLDVAYALLNVGTQKGQYINVLRFSSSSTVYDVVLPYYLDHISYDTIQRRFICVISPLNAGFDSSAISYVSVSYDEENDRFLLEEDIRRIQDDTYSWETTLYRFSMVKNGKLYMSILNTKPEQNCGDLFLKVYDINKGSLLATESLLTNYDLGELGHGLMSGSSAFPMCVRNEKLYVFTSTGQFFVVDDEDNIAKCDMPFPFEDALSVFTPNEVPEESRNSFFGSRVQVLENGTILVLNIYEDGKVIVYRRGAGMYEPIFECLMPENLPTTVIINCFYFAS